MSAAKAAMSSGDPGSAIMDITQLTPENAKRPDMRKIEQLAQKQQHEAVERQAAQDRENAIRSRKDFADQAERQYLLQGMDVHLEARGRDADTLYLKFVLLGRPDVYQFSTDSDLQAKLRELGFKKAIFTDGYDETWTVNIN